MGNNPVNYVDPTGHTAVTATASGSAAALWFGVKFEAGLAIDDNGRIAILLTAGYIQPGITLGAGGGMSLWGVDSVNDLSGLGNAIGGNIRDWGGEIEQDANGKIIGFSISRGGGWPVGLYKAQTKTWVWQMADLDDQYVKQGFLLLDQLGLLKELVEQIPTEVANEVFRCGTISTATDPLGCVREWASGNGATGTSAPPQPQGPNHPSTPGNI